MSDLILVPQRMPPEDLSGRGYKKELNSPLYFEDPIDVFELQERLDLIVGRTIAELAILAKVPIPKHNKSAKGLAGQLVEIFLGAHAGNLAKPDFPHLGIELKTVPINFKCSPIASTYVCMANLHPRRFVPFKESTLYHKIRSLLLVFLLTTTSMPIWERVVAGYCFYEPEPHIMQQIEVDYNEFQELILLGNTSKIDGSYGNILQMLPKGANANDTVLVRNEESETIATMSRGYYLRNSFTKNVIQRYWYQDPLHQDYLAQLAEFKKTIPTCPR